jgi:hypothetical protein
MNKIDAVTFQFILKQQAVIQELRAYILSPPTDIVTEHKKAN